MGFDLTGINPKNAKYKQPNHKTYETDQDKYFDELEKYQNQKGACFRNNVWWWRPLADYVIKFTKVVSEKDEKFWHTNDSHLVDEDHAEQIAKQLDHLIKSGHTSKFAKFYEKRRKGLVKHNELVEKCLDSFEKLIKYQACKDDLIPRDFSTQDKLMWDKLWDKKQNDASYPFSVENVKRFSEFCKNSGGFTIG